MVRRDLKIPRRGSNIYKRKDGRFEGRVAIGQKENGALRYKYVYAHTLSELTDKMLRFQITVQKQPISAIKLTVKDAAEQWLSSAKLRVKPSSYANYENIIRSHIIPSLGSEYLVDITSQQLNNFIYSKMQNGSLHSGKGLSARYVRDVMRVFHSIERYAEQEYGIRETHFTMPKIEKKQLDVLNAEERKKLERHLLANKSISNLAILLCLFTGLRVGELCGLTWGDIDFVSGTLSVNRTVQRINRHGNSEVIIGSPKSKI